MHTVINKTVKSQNTFYHKRSKNKILALFLEIIKSFDSPIYGESIKFLFNPQ